MRLFDFLKKNNKNKENKEQIIQDSDESRAIEAASKLENWILNLMKNDKQTTFIILAESGNFNVTTMLGGMSDLKKLLVNLFEQSPDALTIVEDAIKGHKNGKYVIDRSVKSKNIKPSKNFIKGVNEQLGEEVIDENVDHDIINLKKGSKTDKKELPNNLNEEEILKTIDSLMNKINQFKESEDSEKAKPSKQLKKENNIEENYVNKMNKLEQKKNKKLKDKGLSDYDINDILKDN